MSTDGKAKLVAFYKKYPVLIVAGLVSVVLGGWLYSRSDAGGLEQERLDKNTASVRRYLANIANSAQLQEQLDFLIKANAAAQQRALTAGGLAQNLQYFYRLESETGVKYVDLRPGSTKGAKPGIYVPINYTVGVTGDFAQVVKFLRHIEQGEYISRINTAAASSAGSTITLTLNLDLLGVP